MNKKVKLSVENITFSYMGTPVIEDVSLRLYENEIVCLLGASGSGKTTLFHVIAGLNNPESGRVVMDGEDITGQKGRISYMLQKDMLLPFRTIEDNVSLPLILKGTPKKEARAQVAEHFSSFGLEGTQKKYPKQLSGGMRQRAALFRTYMFGKQVTLLDEPFSALDALTKADMHMWYLDVMKSLNMSTLFVTHDIDEAIFLSDRIYILTGKPGTIIDEFIINEPRPRDREFTLTTSFLEQKQEILRTLNR